MSTRRRKRPALRWAPSQVRYVERHATSATHTVMHPAAMSSTWKYSLTARSRTIAPSPISTTARVMRASSIDRTLLSRLSHRFWLRMASTPAAVTTVAWSASSRERAGPDRRDAEHHDVEAEEHRQGVADDEHLLDVRRARPGRRLVPPVSGRRAGCVRRRRLGSHHRDQRRLDRAVRRCARARPWSRPCATWFRPNGRARVPHPNRLFRLAARSAVARLVPAADDLLPGATAVPPGADNLSGMPVPPSHGRLPGNVEDPIKDAPPRGRPEPVCGVYIV